MDIQSMNNKINLIDLIQSKYKLEKVGNVFRINPCPICHKKDHFTIYPKTNSYSSFSSCCKGGTVYDFLIEVEGLSKKEAYLYMIELSKSNNTKTIASEPIKNQQINSIQNNTNIINELYNQQTNYDKQYFINRGLSNSIIERYKLSIGDVNKLDTNYYGTRAIIPIWKDNNVVSWNSRDIKENSKAKYIKSRGTYTYLNYDYIKTARPNEIIVLTEGEFDALSLETIGVKAISIGGVANYDNFIKNINRDDLIIVTAFDNDISGQTCNNEYKIHIPIKYNDINDWIMDDKDFFSNGIKQQLENILKPHSLFNYIKDSFKNDVVQYKQFKNKKTGFKNLDKITSLYPGLYTIGGISTLGKTTFIHQLADQISEQGDHVLFFSLEMSTLELLTKSIARFTALDEDGLFVENKGVSSLDIRLDDIPNDKRPIVKKAIHDYKNISNRFNVIEGNFNSDIKGIKYYVENYIKTNLVRPVVIVDYLQIIKGDPKSWSDKDELDGIVTELKQLSRKHNLVIIAISSFNRSNYLTPVDFESFNGSGNIEYTADVVWGLQLQAIHDEIFDNNNNIKEKRDLINKEKKSIPRKIELSCLKNRNGISNYSCNFTYYPQHDLFISEDKDIHEYSINTRRL